MLIKQSSPNFGELLKRTKPWRPPLLDRVLTATVRKWHEPTYWLIIRTRNRFLWWRRNRKAELWAIFVEHRFGKAGCGDCWFSCKGHTGQYSG